MKTMFCSKYFYYNNNKTVTGYGIYLVEVTERFVTTFRSVVALKNKSNHL